MELQAFVCIFMTSSGKVTSLRCLENTDESLKLRPFLWVTVDLVHHGTTVALQLISKILATVHGNI